MARKTVAAATKKRSKSTTIKYKAMVEKRVVHSVSSGVTKNR